MESSKKAAIRAYKELKPARGVFAMRCSATNNVWVDSALDLRAAENRTWAGLRVGGFHTEKSILVDYQAHGPETFTFEVLETLDDDVEPISLRDLLKEKKLHWMAQLSARPISPV